ncbi:G-type lectin S-receptor-like serine/threonine-protein kinase LECRK4 [Abrus precatorius]|uniref:non-specific serine/threonine protein kinase n=1 Tax=Abrus precatorius TaxID=3816 RepID=A0A8B8MIV8_ABRPR|nr:G-type lectin S-receptor-like serine/threonine-protein kinase LECRK4 [Abrus precatorius]
MSLGFSLTPLLNNSFWTPPSGDFAFGFQQIEEDGFLLAIWYHKIPEKTVVWFANGQNLAGKGSKMELTSDGQFWLKDPSDKQIWNPNNEVAHAALLDTGNLVLREILEYDGVFRHYVYPKRSNSSKEGWSKHWTVSSFSPTNICLRIGGDQGSGDCGFNSYCTYDETKFRATEPAFFSCSLFSCILIWNRNPKVAKPSQFRTGMNLTSYTWEELIKATNGFNEVLGHGAFATVYKGVISGFDEKLIAVKKLDTMWSGRDEEFKAETKMVSKKEIALAIGRGLTYLHDECRTQIIHCDIKPQNILLDHDYTAKIFEFGLAKLLKLDHTRTTTAVRGTKGYVAPEWFRSIPVSVKVDVYSQGILLLELSCCKKNFYVADAENDELMILAYWAYDSFKDGNVRQLVEDDIEALDEMKVVERYVMTALRSTIKKVLQMLEGSVNVPIPPDPAFL